jgi:hypothetical protein
VVADKALQQAVRLGVLVAGQVQTQAYQALQALLGRVTLVALHLLVFRHIPLAVAAVLVQ